MNNKLSKYIIGITLVAVFFIAYKISDVNSINNYKEIKSVTLKKDNKYNTVKNELFIAKFNTILSENEIKKYLNKGISKLEHKYGNKYYLYTNKEIIDNIKIQNKNLINISLVKAESKISTYIKEGKLENWALSDGDYKLNIEFIKGISAQDIKKILEDSKAKIIDESIINKSIVSIELNPNNIELLASNSEIKFIDIVTPPNTISNSDAAVYNNVSPLFINNIDGLNYNLDGSGVKVQVIDGGSIRNSHQEFINDGESRIYNITNTSLSSHATHVAGTIGAKGIDIKAKGMANNVEIYSYSFLDSYWKNTLMENAYDLKGLKLSNNSYGLSTIYGYFLGRYLLSSKEMDDTIYNNPKLLVIKSAGNDRAKIIERYSKQYGITKGFSNSKNVITIGAASDEANAVSQTNGMTSFSSWGPVLDGRVKPDLVANGDHVYSSYDSSDDDYNSISGTSMASPVVTGITALITQEYENITGSKNIRADLLKALLVNTATDLGNPGVDYSYGFGMVNATKAVNTLKTIVNGNKIFLNSITNNEIRTYSLVLEEDSDVKITLSWLDVGGDAVYQNRNLVNDIDILLYDDVEEFYPYTLDKQNPSSPAKQNKLNNLDNTEQISFNLKAGTYTLKVTGKEIVNSNQVYSIVSSHNLLLNENTNFSFSNIDLPDLVKGQDTIRIPIEFTSSNNNFAYIDAYSDDKLINLNVNKNNILSVSSTIENKNNNANIIISAMIDNKLYETNVAVNLLDYRPIFKPNLMLNNNIDINSSIDYKYMSMHDNKIYASNYITDKIDVYDLNGTLIKKFGENLSNPKGLTFYDNKLYVVNSNKHQIQVYSNEVLVKTFGTRGSGNNSFNTPNAIVLDRFGDIFISDSLNNRIQIYDNNFKFIKTLELILGDRKLNDISSLAFNSNNELFVLDKYSNKIHKFDSDLKHTFIFGGYGEGEGYLDLPYNIIVDVNDDLYVFDKNGLQIFSSSGKFIEKVNIIDNSNPIHPTFISNNKMYLLKTDNINVIDLFSIRKKINSVNEVEFFKNDFIDNKIYNNIIIDSITITELPLYGKLYNNDIEIDINEVLSIEDLNLKYISLSNFKEDIFKFKAIKDNLYTNNAMSVYIKNNNIPIISIDTSNVININENGTLDFQIEDKDNELLDIKIQANPLNGTIIINGNNIQYIANKGYSGSDSFEIIIDDGDGGVIIKTININVNEVNNPPIVKGTSTWIKLNNIENNNTIVSTKMYFDKDNTAHNVISNK